MSYGAIPQIEPKQQSRSTSLSSSEEVVIDNVGEQSNLLGNKFGANGIRQTTAIQIAFVAFFTVAGGSVGIEVCVQAAGPLFTLIAIFVVPLIWSFPQAMMTLEFSTIFDSNGGYIIWVTEGLGMFPGFMNAYLSLYSATFDLALYPALMAQFLIQIFSDEWPLYATVMLKFACVLLIFFLNIREFREIGWASMVFGIIVVIPYFILPVINTGSMNFSNLGDTIPNVQWGLFMSTILWNFTGWDYLGCFAGEVSAPSKSYPRGVLLCIFMIWAAYLIPLAAGMSLNNDWSTWEEGKLLVIAKDAAPWLGVLFMISASFSNLGSFNSMMSTSSRALWRMAKYNMVPSIIGKEHSTGNSKTPFGAVFLKSVIAFTLALTGGFNILVQYDIFFSCLSLLLEFATFVWLKYKCPDLRRPFAVPGGLAGALAITIPKVCVIGWNLYSTEWQVVLISSSVTVATVILYFVWSKGLLRRFDSNWGPPTNHKLISQTAS